MSGINRLLFRKMNRLAIAARPTLSRSFATSAVRTADLPQKEQWLLDWEDSQPVSPNKTF